MFVSTKNIWSKTNYKAKGKLRSAATTYTSCNYTCVSKLFEEQAKIKASNTALIFGNKKLTYKRLNELSNQAANLLNSKGVGEGDIIPICFSAGIEMIVWILGILKVGAAYSPIDPDCPDQRISFLLKDLSASIVVGCEKSAHNFLGKEGVAYIQTNSEFSDIKMYSSEDLNICAAPDSLAYIIYTSGSTGIPKGVMIENRHLLNYLVNDKTNYIKTGENSCTFIHLSYTFDASITAMLMPLINGRSIVIGSKKGMEIFEDENLWKYAPYDFIKTTPAHLDLLASTIKANNKTFLTSRLVVGGEMLLLSHFKEFIEKEIEIEVINEYGPTEATVGCTTYSFWTNRHSEIKNNIVPIGKPIDNVGIYILSSENSLVFAGETGEIFVGGEGVARGYLNNPNLSNERFIELVVGSAGKERLYKTGDFARWLPDGNMEYVGRKDDQVKINGYRIELDEVETVFNNVDCIGSSCAVVKKDKNGIKTLACYYVPKREVVKSKEQELVLSHVSTLKGLYEVEYGKTEAETVPDTEFNLVGWNDSFTGQPIAEQQMREWLQDITEVILAESPKKVLEIGCGMGLIYYQLAGKIEKYIGTDFSSSSINQITKRLDKGLRNYGATELKVCAAHEVLVTADEDIDTVVINSVGQYFPSESYMTDVIKKSVINLQGKGKIIIGDVRDYRLLPLLKGQLLLNKIEPSTRIEELSLLIERSVLQEKELCFSPQYFYNLQSIFPEIKHVDIQWKRATYLNELSAYRFTVVITVGLDVKMIEPAWNNWNEKSSIQSTLTQLDKGEEFVGLKGCPNPRLTQETTLRLALNHQLPSVSTVGELKELCAKESKEHDELNNIVAIAGSKGYKCKLLIDEDELKMNLVFIKSSASCVIKQMYASTKYSYNRPVTNIPLYSDIISVLQEEIKTSIQKTLPSYMMPREIVAIDKFPLTTNGKIDRAFLSIKAERVLLSQGECKAPKNEIEKSLLKIWQDLLAINEISTSDNFFDLGGTSIYAARLFSIIGRTFRTNLPLGILIKAPTIQSLAAVINSRKDSVGLSSLVPIQPDGTKCPLFCIHGGWGNVLFYKHLADHLGKDQPLYALQVKGLNGKEKPFYKMKDMAAHYIKEICSIQPRGPYYLGGHCYGAIVAFEMAHQLRASGEEVALLANFNGVSPTVLFPQNFAKKTIPVIPHNSGEKSTDRGAKAKMMDDLKQLLNADTVEKVLYPLRKLKFNLKYKKSFFFKHNFIKVYCGSCRVCGSRINDKLLIKYLLYAMWEAQERYIPKEYPGEIIIFRSPKLFEDPHMGWSQLIKGNITTYDVPGDHVYTTHVMYNPSVQYIAKDLKSYLS